MFEQQRVHRRVSEVVDRHDLDAGGALDERSERLSTDPAEPIDPDSRCHGWIPHFVA
ncbi:MAG: hypothetical protein ACTS8Z_00325 [Candidatus Limnocylindrales bacterium]